MSDLLIYNQRVAIGIAGGVPVYASYDFLRYIEQQRLRSGGDTAPTNDDLAKDLPEDAGIEETKAALYRLSDEFNSQPPTGGFFPPVPADDGRLQALEAQLARLAQEVEAIKQGVIL